MIKEFFNDFDTAVLFKHFKNITVVKMEWCISYFCFFSLWLPLKESIHFLTCEYNFFYSFGDEAKKEVYKTIMIRMKVFVKISK